MYTSGIKKIIKDRNGFLESEEWMFLFNTGPQIKSVAIGEKDGKYYITSNDEKEGYQEFEFSLYSLSKQLQDDFIKIKEILDNIKIENNKKNEKNYKRIYKIIEAYLSNNIFIPENFNLNEYYEKLLLLFKKILLVEEFIFFNENEITDESKLILNKIIENINMIQKKLEEEFKLNSKIFNIKLNDNLFLLKKEDYKKFAEIHKYLMNFEKEIIKLRKELALISLPIMLNELLNEEMLNKYPSLYSIKYLPDSIRGKRIASERININIRDWLVETQKGYKEKVNPNELIRKYDDENKEHTQDYYALTYKT